MPLGLCNGPATFQRAIEQILADYPELIDDVIVHSQTSEGNLDDIRLLFDLVRGYNLKLGLKKYVFFRKKIGFLGHIVSKEVIQVDTSKVSPIQLMPALTTVKGIQSFLGAAGCYRRFIKDFSKIASPLLRLLRKSVKFDWADECQAAFDQLKKVLAYPDFTKPFILCTDASYIGLGAVLEQCQDCEQRPQPIQYVSSSLTSA